MVITRFFEREKLSPFFRMFIPALYDNSDNVSIPPLAGVFGDGIVGVQYSRQPQRPDVLIDEYYGAYGIIGMRNGQYMVADEANRSMLVNPLFAEDIIIV